MMTLPGVMYFRVPSGLRDTVFWNLYAYLHEKARHGDEIRDTDRSLARRFGATREYINRCLRALEKLEVIERIREHGGRTIEWVLRFASPKPKPRPATRPASISAPRKPPEQTEQNRNRPGREMACIVVNQLKAKGWSLELDEEEKIKFHKLRADAEIVDEDLKRLFHSHVENVRDLLREIKPRE